MKKISFALSLLLFLSLLMPDAAQAACMMFLFISSRFDWTIEYRSGQPVGTWVSGSGFGSVEDDGIHRLWIFREMFAVDPDEEIDGVSLAFNRGITATIEIAIDDEVILSSNVTNESNISVDLSPNRKKVYEGIQIYVSGETSQFFLESVMLCARGPTPTATATPTSTTTPPTPTATPMWCTIDMGGDIVWVICCSISDPATPEWDREYFFCPHGTPELTPVTPQITATASPTNTPGPLTPEPTGTPEGTPEGGGPGPTRVPMPTPKRFPGPRHEKPTRIPPITFPAPDPDDDAIEPAPWDAPTAEIPTPYPQATIPTLEPYEAPSPMAPTPSSFTGTGTIELAELTTELSISYTEAVSLGVSGEITDSPYLTTVSELVGEGEAFITEISSGTTGIIAEIEGIEGTGSFTIATAPDWYVPVWPRDVANVGWTFELMRSDTTKNYSLEEWAYLVGYMMPIPFKLVKWVLDFFLMLGPFGLFIIWLLVMFRVRIVFEILIFLKNIVIRIFNFIIAVVGFLLRLIGLFF